MGRSLDALDSQFRDLAIKLLEECDAAGIHCLITATDRTVDEEKVAMTTGHSWLKDPEKSMHLPQPPEGKSKAIDICPAAYVNLPNWNPEGPYWNEIGKIGQTLGLVWGGNWGDVNGGRGDPGHFQAQLTPMTVTDPDIAV